MSKHQQTINYLRAGVSVLALATVFLYPLAFNPMTSSIFDLNKQTLLILATTTILILWMVKNMVARSFRLTLTPFTVPLFAFSLISIISGISWGSMPQTIEGYLTTTSITLFLLLFYLAITTLKPIKNFTDWILKALIGSSFILAIAAILETVNAGPTALIARFSASFSDAGTFLSPAGTAVILTSVMIPVLLASLVLAIEKKEVMEKSLYFVAAAAITSALVVSIFNILPGKTNSPVFIPFSTSWNVAVENIKSPKNLIIGVGPQNYVQAFSAYKDAEFNQNEFWNTRFTSARNLPLHIFTTTGLLGLSAWLFIAYLLIRTGRHFSHFSVNAKASYVALMAIYLITLFIPQNLVLDALFIFFLVVFALELKEHKWHGTSELLLKFFAAKMVESENFNPNQEDKGLKTELLPIIIGLPVIILGVLVYYTSYRVYAADVAFKSSLNAAANNQGRETYDLQRAAIEANPYLSRYRRSYASTNLALANSLGSQGAELSEQDQQTVGQLIQQAVREARNAVSINPKNPANWETLATTYRNLINVADQADQFTLQAYQEAIRRDPRNPRLRLELGGVFYQSQNYPTAIQLFQQAVGLKPDWANAHYNLAAAYRENGDLELAVAQYDLVLQILDPSNADYSKAQQEQNELKQQIGQSIEETDLPQPNTQLTEPEPLPSPRPQEEQVQLDEESAPPVEDDSQTPDDLRGITDQEASESAEE